MQKAFVLYRPDAEAHKQALEQVLGLEEMGKAMEIVARQAEIASLKEGKEGHYAEMRSCEALAEEAKKASEAKRKELKKLSERHGVLAESVRLTIGYEASRLLNENLPGTTTKVSDLRQALGDKFNDKVWEIAEKLVSVDPAVVKARGEMESIVVLMPKLEGEIKGFEDEEAELRKEGNRQFKLGSELLKKINELEKGV